jgi:hypothetical protein
MKVSIADVFVHDVYIAVEPYLLAAFVVAVLAVGVAVVWRRRRR